MRNPFYQVATLWKYAQAIGWTAAIQLRYSDLKDRAGFGGSSSRELKLENSKFPLLIRTHTSDRDVLRQVFIEEEYGRVELSAPKMILDLGANVGYASAYFLSKYPTASVLAVEPDPGNYAACCSNLKPFGPRAKVLHGAAWVECTKLVLDKGTYRDGREWSTQVRRATEMSAEAEINAYDMPALIGLCGVGEIDLLKIDIERSELDLFSRNTETWLHRVKNLCIELHGSDCEEVFFQALSGYSYEQGPRGDVTVCLNLRARQ